MPFSNNENNKLSNSIWDIGQKFEEMYPLHHVELINVTTVCECVPSQNILSSKWLKRNLWSLNVTKTHLKKNSDSSFKSRSSQENSLMKGIA
jgi:L-fucose isomerase-like protein